MAELLSSLNRITISVSTVVYFILAAFWFSPLLFANAWMKLRNISVEDIGKPNPIIFFYSFILQFIAVISLALFISAINID